MAGDRGARLRFGRTSAAIAGALVVAALATSEILRQRETARLSEEVKAARAEAQAALSAVIEPATIRAVEDSVYLVETPTSFGTAFVIDRERGLLATAAHIAEDIDVIADTESSTVVNRHSKTPIAIVARRVHSGYGSLTRIAESYQPIDPDSPVYDPKVVPVWDSVHDVGLLVADPAERERLGPSIPLASREALAALKTGDPIAVVSFPEEVSWSNAGEEAVASRAERGTIAAVEAPIDFPDVADDARYRTQIAHRLSTGAGSSGAPLINHKGEAIGVHSFGNGPDGVAVRADSVHDLLTTPEEEVSVAATYAPEWRRRLERYVRAEDALPYSAFREFGGGNPFTEKNTFAQEDFSASRPYSVRITALAFGPVVAQQTIAAPDLAPPAKSDPEGRPPPKRITAQATPQFVLPKAGRYVVWRPRIESAGANIIYAFDYAANEQLGYCTIGFYFRRRGEASFQDAGVGASPYAKLDGPGDYEFAFYRPQSHVSRRCAYGSLAFDVGVVSWQESTKSAEIGAPSWLAVAEPRSLEKRIDAIIASALNFANCRLPLTTGICIAPVKARFDAVHSDE